jgi:hypothetical protein
MPAVLEVHSQTPRGAAFAAWLVNKTAAATTAAVTSVTRSETRLADEAVILSWGADVETRQLRLAAHATAR